MEEEKINAKTAFDAATQPHHVEIIKAAIPYINTSEQRVFSVFVKASELAETISVFQRPNANIGITAQGAPKGNMMDMLNDIKAVCTNREQDTINMIINFFNAYQMYRSYNQSFGGGDENASQPNTSNMFDNFKDLLSPEQRQMFDTYSMMMNT